MEMLVLLLTACRATPSPPGLLSVLRASKLAHLSKEVRNLGALAQAFAALHVLST